MSRMFQARAALHAARLDMDSCKGRHAAAVAKPDIESVVHELESKVTSTSKAFDEHKTAVRAMIMKMEGNQGQLHKYLRAWLVAHDAYLTSQQKEVEAFLSKL